MRRRSKMSWMDNERKKYEGVEMPKELDFKVKQAIKQANRDRLFRNYKRLGVVAALGVACIITLNTNTVLAQKMSELPFIGRIVDVITVESYQIEEEGYHAQIDVPQIVENVEADQANNTDSDEVIRIEGEDQTSETLTYLNEKYQEESKALYETFVEDMKDLEENGGGHMGIDSGYEVVVDDEKLLVISRYYVNTVGSSSTTMQYDTVDKVNDYILTLPGLFKDETYVDIISDYIIKDMKQQMEQDDSLIYWVGDDEFAQFEKIKPDQTFYINQDHQLVISFDKYEVTPGYMGVVEFVIPTEIIEPIIVNDYYFK